MFITKKHLPRRTFLRGMGVTLALPLLDSMIPARTLFAQTAAKRIAAARLRLHPARRDHGQVDASHRGAGFEFTPILKPLEPFRDRLNVVTGLGHKAADTTAVHSLSPTTWLSGVRPKATQGVDAYAGITADQIAAQAIGQDTVLPSMELATEDHSGPDRLVRPRLRLHLHEHAVVADADDAAADGDQPAQGLRADVRRGRQRRRAAGAHPGRSSASSTRSPRKRPRLQLQLGPSDRQTMNQYLENMREIERRIQRAEKSQGDETCCCRRGRPACRSTSRSTSS